MLSKSFLKAINDTTYLTISNIIIQFIQLLLVIYITRTIAIDMYGIWVTVMAFVNLFFWISLQGKSAKWISIGNNKKGVFQFSNTRITLVFVR